MDPTLAEMQLLLVRTRAALKESLVIARHLACAAKNDGASRRVEELADFLNGTRKGL